MHKDKINLVSVFEEIWSQAEKRNSELGPVNGFDPASGARFQRIFTQDKRYVTMGIYDTVSKKYSMFNTINLVGNFRYNTQNVPAEFSEMRRMISA